MKRLSATYVAFTAAALTAAVALPAAASYAETSVSGTGNGGASPTPAPDQTTTTTTTDQRAQAAQYRPAKASWYGPGFYGHRTACGTRLTHHTLGVAHKRLPCGTNVALRYQGRTVVVPVIDRGPYSRGVDYDLTYATARSLGMRHTSHLGAAALAG
jgi:rare lipoprotein A (peptidoglycan hydrolase)